MKHKFVKIKKTNSRLLKLLDRLGFGASFLCLIHCLLVPFLLLALPSYSALLGNWHENMHLYLYCLILPISLLAFLPRVFRDKQWEFLGGPGCAVLLLGFTLYFHDKGYLPAANFTEPFLTSVASLTLIYFHWRNFKLRNHKCPTC